MNDLGRLCVQTFFENEALQKKNNVFFLKLFCLIKNSRDQKKILDLNTGGVALFIQIINPDHLWIGR